MTHHNGYYSKTRRVYRKKVRQRGLPGLSKFLIDYQPGNVIDIRGDPSFQKRGLPHRRFIGKTGTIVSIRGRCFEVAVKDINKMKTIFIGSEHISMNKDWQMRNQK